MKKIRAGFTALLAMGLLIWAGTVHAQQTFSYDDLVSRLTNLKHLASLPEPGESCAQWSSYDRASTYDTEQGKYLHWDANGDGGHEIRKEGDKLVLAEMKGPGCIWRIWSALPTAGHVRIYLDEAEEPVVDLPFSGFFDLKNPPFTREALIYEVSKGQNCYLPIPYQKSCKIVADRGWGAYYHFTYSTFPPGTIVPTFSPDLADQASATLDRVCRDLQNPMAFWECAKRIDTSTKVKPDRFKTMLDLVGPAAIAGIRLRLDLPESPADRRVLRELALRITWDEQEQPAVWVPLGDFFGTAPGANVYQSFPMGLTDDGWWYSLWYMPFQERALVELVNDGTESRTVKAEFVVEPLQGDLSGLGRFHAKWHRDALLPEEPERSIDWTILKTSGRGRYVGVMLHVWNPKGGWWGEGDEKFHVDGEPFPSTFGTGSEDYFGYAWCCPKLFMKPFHNQTISMKNKGHVSVNRWHITDNVPFQRSFAGYIEKYYSNERPCLYAGTTFWYLDADGEDPYVPVPVEERAEYCDLSAVTPVTKRVPGALEGEELEVLASTGGVVHEQEMASFEGEWSNNAQLWWTGAKPGDCLKLALPVAKAGRYMIVMQLTRACDYARVQFGLDGADLRGRVDLFDPAVRTFGPFDFGTLDLTEGTHTLSATIVGAHPKAKPAFMVGIDYVCLLPAEE